MKKNTEFLKKYGRYLPSLIARGIKNFGYISLGCSIAALLEIGFFKETIGLGILSLIVIILSYVMMRQADENLKYKLEEYYDEGEY